MTYNLSIEQIHMSRIIKGQKKFIVCDNDSNDFQGGDIINFQPIPSDDMDVYKLRSPLPMYKINYIHSVLGMKPGFVVLGIEEVG
jgi:hypothetical protein